jgi:hypothetical protein
METGPRKSRARGHMKIPLAASGDTDAKETRDHKAQTKVTSENELKGTHRAVGIPPRFSSLQP